MIKAAKKSLATEQRDLYELSPYVVVGYPLSPVTLRPTQEEALVTLLLVLNDKHVDLCKVRLLEVGHGSPALLATFQQIRKDRCAKLEEVVGADPASHADWTRPLLSELNINLIDRAFEQITNDQLFDVIIAVDVFKKEHECKWGPYKHVGQNARALTSLLTESGIVIVINDYNVSSVLSDDLKEGFRAQTFTRYVGDEDYRRRAREVFKLDKLYGHLQVTVHSRQQRSVEAQETEADLAVSF